MHAHSTGGSPSSAREVALVAYGVTSVRQMSGFLAWQGAAEYRGCPVPPLCRLARQPLSASVRTPATGNSVHRVEPTVQKAYNPSELRR